MEFGFLFTFIKKTYDLSWSMVIVIKRPTRGSSSDNEWQRVVQQMIASGTTNDNEWQQMKMSDSEWYNEWQKMTMSDSEWQKVVQRVKAAQLL